MSDILVYAQVEEHGLHDGSLQCLAVARQLAGDGNVAALVIGAGVAEAAAQLFAYGADTVLVADDAQLAHYLTGPHKKVVKDVLATGSFQTILLPATTSGDDLAPVLATDIGAACVMAADAVGADGILQRLEFDRKVISQFKTEGTLVATVKDGIAEPVHDASRTGDIQSVAVVLGEADLKSTMVKRDVTAKTVNLKDAKVIVGVGAGVASEENFAKVKELADALGAQLGATRAVVDAGWLPADHQIGQTGAVIAPDVYIAIGISGAVQHWVGISEAKTIIAVNLDKNCPMMKRAHYRIEGDLNSVVPKLTELAQQL
jgi:electron transfer flavoprotein alpha subunit